jgi:hypothetical protein
MTCLSWFKSWFAGTIYTEEDLTTAFVTFTFRKGLRVAP